MSAENRKWTDGYSVTAGTAMALRALYRDLGGNAFRRLTGARTALGIAQINAARTPRRTARRGGGASRGRSNLMRRRHYNPARQVGLSRRMRTGRLSPWRADVSQPAGLLWSGLDSRSTHGKPGRMLRRGPRGPAILRSGQGKQILQAKRSLKVTSRQDATHKTKIQPYTRQGKPRARRE